MNSAKIASHSRLATLTGAALVLAAGCQSQPPLAYSPGPHMADSVHVGYGIRARSDVLGAVSSITAEELVNVRVSHVAELLEALAADGTVLVQLVEVDGHLHALVAGRGRVRRRRSRIARWRRCHRSGSGRIALIIGQIFDRLANLVD